VTDPIDTVLAEHFAERAKNAANDVSLLPWNDDQGCRRLPVFDDLERLPPWARHGIEWADRAKKADAPAEYVPVACETTVHTILRHDSRWTGVLAIDDMAKIVAVTRRPPWHTYEPTTSAEAWNPDIDPVRLVDWLRRAYGLQMSGERLAACVLNVAQDRHFHPVRDYLSSLTWNGTKRVETFLSVYCRALDGPYAHAVARVLFVGVAKLFSQAIDETRRSEARVLRERGDQVTLKKTRRSTSNTSGAMPRHTGPDASSIRGPHSHELCALIANTCSTGFARDTPSRWAPSRASTTRPASPRNSPTVSGPTSMLKSPCCIASERYPSPRGSPSDSFEVNRSPKRRP
jgi:hypothetical protein